MPFFTPSTSVRAWCAASPRPARHCRAAPDAPVRRDRDAPRVAGSAPGSRARGVGLDGRLEIDRVDGEQRPEVGHGGMTSGACPMSVKRSPDASPRPSSRPGPCDAGRPSLAAAWRAVNHCLDRTGRSGGFRKADQHAHRHHRLGLRRPGFERLLRRFRPCRDGGGQRSRQGRHAAPGRDADLRARTRRHRRRQRPRRPPVLHHGPGRRRGGRRSGDDRGRHAVAPRRRPRRPSVTSTGPRARSRPRSEVPPWW